jgi:hypothetical protein
MLFLNLYMSFLNKSVGYSQTIMLKSDILAPLLQSYNEFVLNKTGEDVIGLDINTGISYDYILSNNNKKYYLLIVKKKLLEETCNQKYDILYLFPDRFNQDLSNKTLEQETDTDFYLEIDSLFNDEFLLEGYLYKRDGCYEYLLTDILMKNRKVIDVAYELRYTLLNEVLKTIGGDLLKKLNNHMSINIHPVFSSEDETMMKIFNNNFLYKDQIKSIEKISHFTKRRYLNRLKNSEKKLIEPSKYTDVYNVYNIETNNAEGILYVKGIRESKFLKQIFSNTTRTEIQCDWNTQFSKWQPVF